MKTFQELQEGIQDPNIFKAFFLAGGPGSGKSFIVKKGAGIGRGGGLAGLKKVNSDDVFEKYLKDAGLEMDMTTKKAEEEEEERDVLRHRAKEVTTKRRDNYVDGRLGLIIDGTGKDYSKIVDQANDLRRIGYDCYMIYVNTSLDVALERNRNRERKVHDSIAIKSWKSVQANLGPFSQHFKNKFMVVDNNDKDDAELEKALLSVGRQISSLLKNKVTNPTAKQWVMQQMKERGITRMPKGF